MTNSTKKAGLVIKSSVKAGGFWQNHNRNVATAKKSALKVKSNVRAGGFTENHNRAVVSAR